MASVLKRKAEIARDRPSRPAAPADPAKALADAVRRAVEEELEAAVVPGEVRERQATPAELLEALPDHAFLGVLIGPEDGAGLICLDAALLSAVVELRTVGRVSSREPLPRRPTRTDAAMVADLIDRVLAEFEAPLLEVEAARWASGWRYQLFLPDPRPLAVVLEEVGHRVLEIDIGFAAPGKSGRLMLALPASGRARPRAPVGPPAESCAGEAEAAWRRGIGEAVGGAEASLDAVLGRVRLTLADLAALAPGDRIALPVAALGSVRLMAPGGCVVAGGRLGQSGGARAIRLGVLAGAPPPAAVDGALIGPDSMVEPDLAGNLAGGLAASAQAEGSRGGDVLGSLLLPGVLDVGGDAEGAP